MSTQFFTGMAAANRGFDAGVERTRQAYDNRRATQQTYNIRQAEHDTLQEQRRQAAGFAQADLDFAAGVDPFLGVQPGQAMGDTTAPVVGLQPPTQTQAQASQLTPSQMFGQIVAPSEAPAAQRPAQVDTPVSPEEAEPGMTITITGGVFGTPELDQWPVIRERMPDQSRNEFSRMRRDELNAVEGILRGFRNTELTGFFGFGPTGLFRRRSVSEMDFINMGFTSEAEAREIQDAISNVRRGETARGPVGKYFLERPGLIQEFERLPREQKIQVIRNILNDGKPVEQQLDQGSKSGAQVVNEIVERTKQAGVQSPDRAPKELQQEPSSKLSRIYLDNPEMPTAHQQRAMQQRERLVAYIQRLQRVGGPQAAAAAMQARMQVDQIDERLHYLEGMKAINQFRDFGDPRLLSGVWSHYSGQQVDVAPTPAGNYDIIVNGQPYAQAVGSQAIISTVELLFNEVAQENLRAMQAMRAEKAIEFEYLALEERVKLERELQVEITKGSIKVAAEKAKNAGMKLHNDGAGNVYGVATDPYGGYKIYQITENGFEDIGFGRTRIPPSLVEIR